LFLDDGALAVAWVQKHAQAFGGDPQRIVLMGHSAGGHEAALLAYDQRFLQQAGARPDWIVGLVALSGPYALAPDTKVLNAIFASPYTEVDWQPIRFVTPRAPPTLLVHGTADGVVSIRHAERLRDVLQANACVSKRTSIRARDTPIPWRGSPCLREDARPSWIRA
jgi:acetyl esterase/lipase